MEKRIIQLETLVTLQDETIQSLNIEIFRQQKDIAQLRRQLEVFEKKIEEMQNSQEIAGNERPPHW
ncbi:MAG TPA: SlyX family protein [Pontiella sp.]